MAELSVTLFWVGVALTAAASLFQLGAAFGSRVVRRAAVTNAGTITLAERQPPPLVWQRLGSLLSLAAAATLVLMLVTRTMATGHPPYSNMFEYLTAFGAGVVMVAVVIERRGGRRAAFCRRWRSPCGIALVARPGRGYACAASRRGRC